MRRFALCALVSLVVLLGSAVVWGQESPEVAPAPQTEPAVSAEQESPEVASEQESPEAASGQETQEAVAGQETPPAQPKTIVSKDGLAGLREVSIIVKYQGKGYTGLEDLQTTLTAALLRSRTVQVVEDKDKDVPARFYLLLRTSSINNGQIMYMIRVWLDQAVLVPRADGRWLSVRRAITWYGWDEGGSRSTGDLSETLKTFIRDKVDNFTIDYFKANPLPVAHQEQETETPAP